MICLVGLFCFFCIFQTSRSKRYVSAMDEKEVVPALLRVLKSIFQGDHVYLKTEIVEYRVYRPH